MGGDLFQCELSSVKDWKHFLKTGACAKEVEKLMVWKTKKLFSAKEEHILKQSLWIYTVEGSLVSRIRFQNGRHYITKIRSYIWKRKHQTKKTPTKRNTKKFTYNFGKTFDFFLSQQDRLLQLQMFRAIHSWDKKTMLKPSYITE